MTLTADEIGRLYGLLSVASDPALRASLPQSWWASLGRDLAEVVPRLLVAQADFIDAADAVRHAVAHPGLPIGTLALSHITYDRARKTVVR
jgi:hypothetical protein